MKEPTRNPHLSGRRLYVAIQIFLGLYLAMLMIPKWRHVGNVFALLVLVCAVALAFVRPFPKGTTRVRWMFIGGLLTFLGINLLAILLAEDIPDRGRVTYEYVQLPGVVVALAFGLGVRDEKAAWRLITVLLVAAGLWYVGEVVSLLWRSPYLNDRFVGARGHHVILAMELLILCALCLATAAAVKNRAAALLALAGAALTGVLILMTKTRLAMLTLVLVAVPCIVLVQRRVDRWRVKLAAVCVWVLLVTPAAGLAWWYSTSPDRKSFANVRFRFASWEKALVLVARQPWHRAIIGQGRFRYTLRAVSKRYLGERPKRYFWRIKMRHAHNVLLQTLVETGIVGVAALVLVWGTAFYSAGTAWLKGRGRQAIIPAVMLTAIVTMVAMSQLDYCLWKVPGRLCWFVVGLAFACRNWGMRCVGGALPVPVNQERDGSRQDNR